MNLENKLFLTLANIIDGTATFFMLLILIRALMTWLRQDVLMRFYKVFKFVAGIIDPLMNFTARILPVRLGMIDFTPVVALFIVEALKYQLLFVLKLFFRV